MKIAILKERRPHETRVAATPETVKKLKALGADVAVQICEDVVALGAHGLHFYTLNQSEPVVRVISQLSVF